MGRLFEEEEARQRSNQSPLDVNAHEVNATQYALPVAVVAKAFVGTRPDTEVAPRPDTKASIGASPRHTCVGALKPPSFTAVASP
jgi:hypothetical protein